MEDARRKLRVCLITVVAVAVIVGLIYYFGSERGKQNTSEGTLVKAEWQQVVTPSI